VLSRGERRWEPGAEPGAHAEALHASLDRLSPAPDAIGHRVVHGGPGFHGPAVIDEHVRAEILRVAELAPLHNRGSLEGIAFAHQAFAGLPQVACFDTAFHHTLPPASATYPLPRSWRERLGLRRFGFHGLNVEYCTHRAAEILGPERIRRLVVCHLGSGSSVTAVRDGRSHDTTMGFTPLEGVPMATRSGSFDPAIVLALVRHGTELDELEHGLSHHSGLRALAGTNDLRQVIARADQGDVDAQLAFDIYVRGIAAAIAAMTTALFGLDCLVFTGGAGEGSAPLRQAVTSRVEHLGALLSDDPEIEPDGQISPPSAPVAVLVLRAGEEIVIAQQTWQTLS